MTIGEQIRKRRLDLKLSQRELGSQLGVSQQQIAQYENGKRLPKITTLLKIAGALCMDSSPLLEAYTEDALSVNVDIDEKEFLIYKAHEENKKLNNSETEQDYNFFTFDGVLISDKKLLDEFHTLNKLGKKEAILRISELKYIPGYTGDDGIPID